MDTSTFERVLEDNQMRCVMVNVKEDIFKRPRIYLHPHFNDFCTASEEAFEKIIATLSESAPRVAYDSTCNAFVMEFDTPQ